MADTAFQAGAPAEEPVAAPITQIRLTARRRPSPPGLLVLELSPEPPLRDYAPPTLVTLTLADGSRALAAVDPASTTAASKLTVGMTLRLVLRLPEGATASDVKQAEFALPGDRQLVLVIEP